MIVDSYIVKISYSIRTSLSPLHHSCLEEKEAKAGMSGIRRRGAASGNSKPKASLSASAIAASISPSLKKIDVYPKVAKVGPSCHPKLLSPLSL